MNKEQVTLFMSLIDRLKVSRPTMHRYKNTGDYPAEICLKAERETDGKLLAVTMRPDLFTETHDQRQLALSCVAGFKHDMSPETATVVIGILNYLERQQPSLYDEVLNRIGVEVGGELFILQREAHKQNERS